MFVHAAAQKVAQKVGSGAAVRRAIRIAHHYRRNGIEWRAQFLGHDLLVRRECRALTEISFAGANQDRVVRMYLNPGSGKCRVERVLSSGSLRPHQAEADKQSASHFDEVTARESSAENAH